MLRRSGLFSGPGRGEGPRRSRPGPGLYRDHADVAQDAVDLEVHTVTRSSLAVVVVHRRVAYGGLGPGRSRTISWISGSCAARSYKMSGH